MGIIEQLTYIVNMLTINIEYGLYLVAVCSVIEVVNMLLNRRLCLLGIIPRNPISLITGPICSHFIHAGFNHMFFNMFPLFVLSVFMMEKGLPHMLCVSLMMMYSQSLLLWLFGQRGIHVGASGLVMSYLGYLIYSAYHSPNLSSILLALIGIYYFGAALFSIFPDQKRTSWDGHLFGLISGVGVAHFGQCLYPFNVMTGWLLTHI
ncbi:MAG: rhomboid family intramembrane serine protease [Legionellales bacterium]|nr:rhomboid family intramembrane serine protease [Legionellales bacterium]|tara:strand:+ start:207 stop:824 length:618 start_codon:yes stop_codon:yes gene_type:complete